MARELKVISGNKMDGVSHRILGSDEKLKHFQNTIGVVLQDAQRTWADVWKELQGQVVDGALILPEAEKGFKPECGWPEFLEKLWLLKHYLDYATQFTQEMK
jgi:hypothetical protein